MAGFSQQLQGAPATAAPITEGIGEDMNLKGIAAGLGLASTLIGSSYAESQMDKQFKDVVADYQEATKALAPATDKLNILADTYQKTKDPMLLREMTDLNDKIRRIKLGEAGGKFSGIAASARIEAAYKTAIHKFPKYASELRFHKEAVVQGGGAVTEAVDGSKLMFKQAEQSTKLLAKAMFEAGYNINSPQERVRYMALKRLRWDRDMHLKDVEAGYKAILTPLEMANKIMEEKNKPEEIRMKRYERALDMISKKLGIEKKMIDMKDYYWKTMVGLKMKEIEFEETMYKHGYFKEAEKYKLESAKYGANNAYLRYGYNKDTYNARVGTTKRTDRVGAATEDAKIENPYLQNTYTKAKTARTNQTIDHSKDMYPGQKTIQGLTIAEKQRIAKNREFSLTSGIDKVSQIREELFNMSKHLLESGNALSPQDKGKQLQAVTEAQIGELQRFYAAKGMEVPQSQISALRNYSDKMAGYIESSDKQTLLKHRKENHDLEVSLGKELWRTAIGDANFKKLAMNIVKLKAKIEGEIDPAKKKAMSKEVQKLEDTYSIMSKPSREIMDIVRADKLYPHPDGSVDPAVAWVYALDVATFKKTGATTEKDIEEGVKSLEKATKNSQVALDVLDTTGAINLATVDSKARTLYVNSFKNGMKDAANYVGADGKLSYDDKADAFKIRVGNKGISIPLKAFDWMTRGLNKHHDLEKVGDTYLSKLGVSERRPLLVALSKLKDVIKSGGYRFVKPEATSEYTYNNTDLTSNAKKNKGSVVGEITEFLGLSNDKITGKIWKDGWSKKSGEEVAKNYEKWKSKIEPIVSKLATYDPVITPELMIRMMGAESGFRDSVITGDVKSGKDAVGILQMIPSTVKSLGYTVEDLKDYKKAIPIMYKYLKQLETQYDGDLYKIVAAYNAGPSAVNKYGGVPPYKETINYVKKVLGDKFKVSKKKSKKKKVYRPYRPKSRNIDWKKVKKKVDARRKARAKKELEALLKKKKK